MAWQLIYTSAPRSLEAGRSGFGTVARHRAISPLLVSAIERTSQFSRLPGVDTGRVIFSYRIVAVAGGRFHVLSSIRDAGADYTGRTNHIAHHLIADPREIAQLGANGPSPADVLLAMKWATSWTDQPRFFEATDEVALATIRPVANGSAWERITGSPEQAWLLASGDASRGAYVIQPAGTDLREVFAESLQLIPERLWQISFTTSLQPSDEPADFRWIGIEERSPLRAQTESSGRPVLNLAAPSTLPLIEVLQPTAATQIRQSFAQTSAPSSSEKGGASPKATSVTTLQRPSRTPNGQAVETLSTSPTVAIHSYRKWWLLAGAMIVVVTAVAVLFIGRPIYAKYQHRKAVHAQIDLILSRSGYFSDKVRMELKSVETVDVANELAGAADRSWQMAYNADFAAMLQLPDKALRERARNVNLNIPAEINALDDRLEKIAGVYKWLCDFHPQPQDAKALDEIEEKRSQADQLTSPTIKTITFENIRGVIGPLADKLRAQTVLILLTGASDGRVQPAQTADWFKKILSDTKFAAKDDETQRIFKAAQKLLDDWKFVDAQETTKVPIDLEQRLDQRPDWPSWLRGKAQGKIALARTGKIPAPNAPTTSSSPPHKSAPLSRVPLYFVNGKDSLSKFGIEELGPNLNFFFKQGLNGSAVELADMNKNGKLRRTVGGAPDFELGHLDKDGKFASGEPYHPGAAKGLADIALPFCLSAKDASGKEVFQVWVCTTSGEPLFQTRTNGFIRNGDTLELNPAAVGFAGTPKNPLLIKLPDSCFATKTLSEPQPLANWSVDLSGARKRIDGQRIQWTRQLAELEKIAAEPHKDEKAKFADLVEDLEKEAKFDEQERKKIADNTASLRERCGGYLQAISLQLRSGGDPLFKAGEAMKPSKPVADGKKEDEVTKTAIGAVQDAIRNLKTNEEKKAYEAKLKRLLQMLGLLMPETAETKAARLAETEARKGQLDALKSQLEVVHPLTSDRVPPGTYRVFARDGGADIPLVEIQIPQFPKQ